MLIVYNQSFHNDKIAIFIVTAMLVIKYKLYLIIS
jgi:hypothetical protein